jgi:hypothetical protein
MMHLLEPNAFHRYLPLLLGAVCNHAGATPAEPMQISELGCPDKPRRLEDLNDGSDIPQPARSMQVPATVQRDQCRSGVQEL